ncbi:hypothetical protein CTM45_11280 [Prevotella intermedia]|uniref:Uncharacterized protein n=1 Tax=Prevotella intermedia TaxID=28131 RepID=A0A2D3LN25_PREIN|nr:hypothetical protein CTM46_10850 [Prevotella intermedia]PJI21391.1 hypothetical protein CTM45_11280 [Prevotella intermedia]
MLLIAASLYNVAKLLNFSHILKYIAFFFNIDIKKVAQCVYIVSIIFCISCRMALFDDEKFFGIE